MRSGLPSLLAALLGSGGCTLLVGAQLSDKPEEATGAGGGGGQVGDTAASSSAQMSSGPSVGSSSVGSSASASSSAGSGGMMCSKDLADCDGKPMNGCEINIKTDAKNCGACGAVCFKPKTCNESKCQ